MPSNPHKSKQETKKHSDKQTSASTHGQSAAPKAPAVVKKTDPIPLPEHGAHSHSYAAHLGSPTRAYSAPLNFRQSSLNQLREPPQQMGRIGKQHRG